MSNDSHISSFLIISSPQVSCNGYTTTKLLKKHPSFSFLHIIAVQDALPNSVSSSYLEQGLQSTNNLIKTKMIHNGQRVLMQCNHCVKCFPSYILIKHIIFNSYCTLVSGCKLLTITKSFIQSRQNTAYHQITKSFIHSIY